MSIAAHLITTSMAARAIAAARVLIFDKLVVEREMARRRRALMLTLHKLHNAGVAFLVASARGRTGCVQFIVATKKFGEYARCAREAGASGKCGPREDPGTEHVVLTQVERNSKLRSAKLLNSVS